MIKGELGSNVIELEGNLDYRGQRGPVGKTPNIQIGEITTVEENEEACVTRKGSDENPILDFALPRGKIGPPGEQGISGVYCGTEEPPEEFNVWIIPDGMPSDYITEEEYLEKINQLDSLSDELKKNGEYAKTIAEQLITDKENGLFKGEKGDPFSFNDFTEEQLGSLKGEQGIQGSPGNNGQDGVGITNITQNEDSSLTITLSNGNSTTTAPLKGNDGQDGEIGPQGSPGRDGIDGINGQDGYTPVKGTDYWTESDINDIKQHCSDYIDENYLSKLGGSY